MGVDKALAPLAGRPLVAHVVARLAPQVDALFLNANGDGTRFAELRCAIVVADAAPSADGGPARRRRGGVAPRAIAGRPMACDRALRRAVPAALISLRDLRRPRMRRARRLPSQQLRPASSRCLRCGRPRSRPRSSGGWRRATAGPRRTDDALWRGVRRCFDERRLPSPISTRRKNSPPRRRGWADVETGMRRTPSMLPPRKRGSSACRKARSAGRLDPRIRACEGNGFSRRTAVGRTDFAKVWTACERGQAWDDELNETRRYRRRGSSCGG